MAEIKVDTPPMQSMEEIQEYIKAMGWLRCTELSQDEEVSIVDVKSAVKVFLLYCENNINEIREIDSNGNLLKTFYRRTITDIYRACLYYFPECNLEDVYNALFSLVKERQVRMFRCPDLDRVVYHWYESDIIFYSFKHKDEYGTDLGILGQDIPFKDAEGLSVPLLMFVSVGTVDEVIANIGLEELS